jgi:hypothetical protein
MALPVAGILEGQVRRMALVEGPVHVVLNLSGNALGGKGKEVCELWPGRSGRALREGGVPR